jgi:membrane protease YdiL (CAAX protease family)
MSARSLGNVFRASGLTAWVLVAFVGAQLIAALVFIALSEATPIFAGMNQAVQATVLAALSYVVSLSLLIAAERLIRRGVSKESFGVSQTIRWRDIGIALAAVVPYFFLSALLVIVFNAVFQIIDPTQSQDLPFKNLVDGYEYVVAFIALVVLAPLVEELVFRGYYLGKLSRLINKWAAVFITAAVFGALHLFGEATETGVTLQWAVALDTFALGLVLGALRIWLGSVWAGVLLHMTKNGIAYFYLFIYPLLTGTM